MKSEPRDILAGIPSEAEIRAQLAQRLQEANALRALLRVARKKPRPAPTNRAKQEMFNA